MRRMMRLLVRTSMIGLVLLALSYFGLSTRQTDQCARGDGVEGCIETAEAEAAQVNHYLPTTPTDEQRENSLKRPTIHLSVVACGDRLDESVVLLKSATLFTRAPLHAHIFADDELRPQFEEQLNAWPEEVKAEFTYSMYPIEYPANQNAAEWKKLFKDILKDTDALLYVDTDILFLRPLDDLWRLFSRFNSTQVAGMAPESEEGTAAWYSRFARHPYVPPHGINSGVMLMNMTRMRKAGWLAHIVPYYKKHRYDITWGDQDLINIFFHYFPDKLYQFPCHFNYRPDHCMYMSNCKSGEEKGVSVLHGSRSAYHNDKQPAFKAVYEAIRDYKFGDSLQDALLPSVATNLRESAPSQCGKISQIFTKQFERQVQRHATKKSPAGG